MAALTSRTAAADWPPPTNTPVEDLSVSEFWPDDPNFGYSGVNYAEPTKPGQWWLYSFVPERARTAGLLRQPGLASGLSVDAAWRYGLGQGNVLLAFIDDGIDWAQSELASDIVLNPFELLEYPPTRRDQTPCPALIAVDPNSLRFDCAIPADGALTVRDYADKLGWLGDDQRIDPNGNGILDAGDILLMSANGKDDDGNGLIDDISGWDFVDSDELPEHGTTRHGTEVALDAMADAGDEVGRAGVCPKCIGLPIRFADQRGADPQRLALAILYAVSRGARAALVGHLPAGRSETLDIALQNAAQRGMLVIFPEDGEQQSYSPILFESDAWLPIGGLTVAGDPNVITKATSFVALDPCQALAPGINFMGAGPPCSRRSPAVVLGIAGLVASVMPAADAAARLTAAELAATLKWSSDTIDTSLTGSEETAASAHASIRRLNANAAVERTRAGLVPPEISIDNPRWYEPVVIDRQKTPIAVSGRVTASRAEALDLEVSMAVGNNPAEAAYRTQYSRQGLAPNSAPTSSSTIATLDLRTWLHSSGVIQDQEARRGTVVTIRVTATAHYKGSSDTASSIAERRIFLLEDPDLLVSAPIHVGASPTSPKLADVNGDGQSDIVLGTLDGRILAISAMGNRLVDLAPRPIYTKPTADFSALSLLPLPTSILEGTPKLSSSSGHSAIPAAPATGDLDADGVPEIVVATLDGRLYAAHADGTFLSGWNHVVLPRVVSPCHSADSTTECKPVSSRMERGVSSSPVIADVNGDGLPEVLVAAHDGQVHAYSVDGSPLMGWPILIGTGPHTQPGRLTRSPAVGDFNGDSIDDLVVTAGEEHSDGFGRGLHVLVLGAKAPELPHIAEHWPVGVATFDVLVDKLDRSTPGASVDDSSNESRALLYGNSTQPFFVALNPGTTSESDPEGHADQLPSSAEPVSSLDGRPGFDLSSIGAESGATSANSFAPMLARPSIGDLDRDGTADVVLPGLTQPYLDALRVEWLPDHQAEIGLFNGRTGQMLPGAPIAIANFIGTASAAIADVTNDGYPEVIATDGGGNIIAVDACGRSAPGWPKRVAGAVDGTPAVGDIDNDNLLEVVVTTRDGWLYVWKTQGTVGSYVPWPSEQNDAANQSNYGRPTGAAAPNHAWQLPIDGTGHCILPPAPQPETEPMTRGLSARGGCTCSLSSAHAHSPLTPLIIGAMLLGLVRYLMTHGAEIRARKRVWDGWCRRTDLNRRHRAYEARALTD